MCYVLCVSSYLLTVMCYQLYIISYQLSVISYQLSVISYQYRILKMTQIISVVQEKGGAGKSTILASLSAVMAKDGAKVAIIDTDPQKTISTWVEKKENVNIDHHYEDDDSKIVKTVKSIKAAGYDVIFIDTAGYKSVMTMYAINLSNLVLIPSKASEPDARGAFNTYNQVQSVSEANDKNIPAYIILNDVDKLAKITNAVKSAFIENGVPTISSVVFSRTGFKEMMSEGGCPTGSALSCINAVIGAMQIDGLLDFYKGKNNEN